MSDAASKVTLLADANNTKSKTPNLYNQFEINGIEQSILQAFKKLKAEGASYVFLVMFILDKVGFAKATETIKAIANIENILQKIMGDLGDFSQLLKDLLDHIDLSKYCGDKGDTKDNWRNATVNQIEKWLTQGKNGPNGNMTNGQYLIYLFKDLFGANGKGGLLAQYQKAINNPWCKQDGGSVVSGLQKLLNGQDGFTGSNWTTSSPDIKYSFLDFLTGKVPFGEHFYEYMADAMYKAVSSSYFNRTGQKPKGDTKSYEDIVGDSTNDIDGTKGAANGVNTEDSSKESMQAQNLESLDKTGQTIISNYSNFTQKAADNQKGQ